MRRIGCYPKAKATNYGRGNTAHERMMKIMLTNTVEQVSPEAIAAIHDALVEQMVRRGYHAPIQVEMGKGRLNVKSDPFNTVPVIFQKVYLANFGGAIKVDKDNDEWLAIWVPIHVRWQSFGGGDNGTDLFNFSCKVRREAEYDFEIGRLFCVDLN